MNTRNHKTQRQQILNVLLEAKGGWVSLPRILELKISQFGARILELRRLGFHISNRVENVDGQKHSWYRLESGLPPAPPTKLKQITPAPAVSTTGQETMTLFPMGSLPERWIDPEEGGR